MINKEYNNNKKQSINQSKRETDRRVIKYQGNYFDN